MRGDEFLDKMELISPKFIEEAEGSISLVEPSRKKFSRFKKLMVAACIAFVAVGGITKLIDSKDVPSKNLPDLPAISISEDIGSGLGYEAETVKNIDELSNSNPWCEVKTLPVFKNQLSFEGIKITGGVDFKAMRKVLNNTAKNLGLDPTEFKVSKEQEDLVATLSVKTKFKGSDATITVDHELTAEVRFEPGIKIPKPEYSKLIDMKEPRKEVSRTGVISLFEEKGSLEEQIINYNFNKADFVLNEGKLVTIRIHQPDLSEKVADYPVMSQKEAEKLLVKGKYVTSVPHEMPGKKYVEKVELVYRHIQYDEYFIPYYRFLVDITKLEDGGAHKPNEKTYGAYYVPAVYEKEK